ncbi:MAG: WecB/TagA/CpsF family glycosyltransferase [Thiobacillus sp.]|nr:WecB/TagA/CpsF family glycosyltransferase [Thiobacillus sp.]
MVTEAASVGAVPWSGDFDRPVYCLLGLPFDAVDMATAVRMVRGAASRRSPLFLSTPNLNFLIGCQHDEAFRDSVIHSELSVADGMPLVWLARLLRIPIPERVAGSGLFEALESVGKDAPLRVFFFGGPEGMAERACKKLSATSSGLTCSGFLSPGFGDLDDMSGEVTLSTINSSRPDFLVVALGARKGQAWIERNRLRLDVPVISHLGAVVNFVAGSVSRAPVWMQKSGLEWLWRIKEEPGLWQRYWRDGMALLGLLWTRALPYAIWLRARRRRSSTSPSWNLIRSGAGEPVRMVLEGSAPDVPTAPMRDVFRQAASLRTDVVVDLTKAEYLSPAFFGLLMVLKKHTDANGRLLRIQGVSDVLQRQFYWNAVDFLLGGERGGATGDRGGTG